LGEELPDAFHFDPAERHQAADALDFVDQNRRLAELVVNASFNLVEQTRDGVQTNSRHGGRVGQMPASTEARSAHRSG